MAESLGNLNKKYKHRLKHIHFKMCSTSMHACIRYYLKSCTVTHLQGECASVGPCRQQWIEPGQVGLKKGSCLTIGSWWQRRGDCMSMEDTSTRYPAQVTTQLNNKEWVTTQLHLHGTVWLTAKVCLKMRMRKTVNTVTVFQENLAKAWITLKH